MPIGVYERILVPAETRFWAKVDKTQGEDGCWLWLGAVRPKGYGVFALPRGVLISAHRFLVPDPLPGYQWDHRCHTEDMTCAGGASCLHRRCVNPKHLQLVLRSINASERWRRDRAQKVVTQ